MKKDRHGGAWFRTQYRGNWVQLPKADRRGRPGTYSGSLWARSMADAHRIVLRRGLGEIVLWPLGTPKQYVYASDLIVKKIGTSGKAGEKRKLHALCYLGMLALASGVATVQEVIGDNGFIHEFCHGKNRHELRIRIRAIERRVPGYRAGYKRVSE